MAIVDRERWQALEPLLDRALDLTGAERAAWLDALRAREPALAESLAQLLSAEAAVDAHGFLAAPLTASIVTAPAGSLAGLPLGAYTLERQIGHGGMGSVWLARRADGRFEGVAAVKLLNLALLTPAGRERFRREGAVLARLAHPGIARLLDAGVTADGQPYLVLEHVDGVPLDEFARAHALPIAERVRLLLRVLDAVGHAHASLVVHRDLKPSNILVTADGAPKLLDFGIAKLLDADGAGERSVLTLEAGRALTPQYAAPEQVRGDAVTTATDVYALGVLLHVLLSGRHPTAEGRATPAEVIHALFEAEPARLGLGDLDTVLAKALRKAPGERYQTVAAFGDDLARWLRQEPVRARPASVAYLARTFVRRHRVGVVAGALVAATLVGATAFSLARAREARRQRDAAVFEQQRADAQVEFQNLLLASFGAGSATMREILDRGVVLLEREYAGNARVAGSIALTLGMQYGELGEYARQLALEVRAESLAVVAADDALRLRTRCVRMTTLRHRGLDAASAALRDSVRTALPTAAPADAAACLELLAELDIRAGRFDSATAAGRRAVAILERLGDTTGMPYVGALNTMANALENAKRRREALAIYRRIAAVMDSTGRAQSSGRNVFRNNIGLALSNLGEMTAAEPILHETIETFRRGDPSGEVHPAILINYCRTALFLRQLDSAAVWYERLARQLAAGGGYGRGANDGAYGMARVELLRGRLPEAARWVAEVKRIDGARVPPQTADGHTLDGVLARLRGDPAGARAHLGLALRAYGYHDGKRPYNMRAVLVDAAEAALAAGVPGEALEYARAAHGIATSDSLSETRSAYVGEARLLEGRAQLAAGDTAAARGTLARAATALHAGAGAEHPRTREARALLDALAR